MLCSILHRQQGEGRRARQYADNAVKLAESGKIQLLFRGSLYHSLGRDHKAINDFKVNILTMSSASSMPVYYNDEAV